MFTERYIRADAAGGGDGTADTAGSAWTLPEAIAAAAPGMRINWKAGTYPQTTNNRAFATSGTAAAPIRWQGFRNTPGDMESNNLAVNNVDIPLVTFTTGQVSAAGSHQQFCNLYVASQCTAGGGAWTCTGAGITLYRCLVNNSAANAAAQALNFAGTGEVAIGCYFGATVTASRCINLNTLTGALIGCRIIGGVIGVSATTQPAAMHHCTLANQAGDGVNTTVALTVNNCSFHGCLGHGVTAAAGSHVLVMNCVFVNISQPAKAAIAVTGGDSHLLRAIGNAYYNCTSNRVGIVEDIHYVDNPTLASNPLPGGGSWNFALAPVAKGLGYPGGFYFEGTEDYRGYLDPGAVQRIEPPSAGIIMPNPFGGGYDG